MTNEAAERLRESFTMHGIEDWTPGPWEQLDAALAEERRHVIEQVEEAVRWVANEAGPYDLGLVVECRRFARDVRARLDDLSTPEQDR